jgi:hypothetical protein
MESEAKPSKAHHENGQKESLDLANIAHTSQYRQPYAGVEDYELKEMIAMKPAAAARRRLDCFVGHRSSVLSLSFTDRCRGQAFDS